jgi:hypothetical protein
VRLSQTKQVLQDHDRLLGNNAVPQQAQPACARQSHEIYIDNELFAYLLKVKRQRPLLHLRMRSPTATVSSPAHLVESAGAGTVDLFQCDRCPTLDSNPDCAGFESALSASWSRRAGASYLAGGHATCKYIGARMSLAVIVTGGEVGPSRGGHLGVELIALPVVRRLE